MPWRPKNRPRKLCFFRNRFYRDLISILESLGPPSWSQVNHFGKKIWDRDPLGPFLTCISREIGAVERPKLDLEAPGIAFGSFGDEFFEMFGCFLGRFLEIMTPAITSVIPSVFVDLNIDLPSLWPPIGLGGMREA